MSVSPRGHHKEALPAPGGELFGEPKKVIFTLFNSEQHWAYNGTALRRKILRKAFREAFFVLLKRNQWE